MLKVDGVEKLHDLHVWTITSGVEALSTHVVLAENCDPKDSDRVLKQLSALPKETFGIDHSTIQIEKSSRHEKECSTDIDHGTAENRSTLRRQIMETQNTHSQPDFDKLKTTALMLVGIEELRREFIYKDTIQNVPFSPARAG